MNNDTIKLDGIEYDVEYCIEPEQRGGMTDPSWPAHAFDLGITINGKIIDDEEIHSAIAKVIDNELQDGSRYDY